jgi:hypothetical protein
VGGEILLAAGVGGAAYWLWSAISWMVLPWHHATFARFRDEDEVVGVLSRNAPATAVYGLPAPPAYGAGWTAEQRAAEDARVTEAMGRGPLVLAVVRKEGFPPVWRPMLVAALVDAAAAGCFGAALLRTDAVGLWDRALLVAAMGVGGGIACRLSDWTWHGYPAAYTLVNLADAAIGWLLAGLAIAAVL